MFARYLPVHIHILVSTWQIFLYVKIPFQVNKRHSLMTCLQSLFCFVLILFVFWIGGRCTWYKIPKVQELSVKSKSPVFLLLRWYSCHLQMQSLSFHCTHLLSMYYVPGTLLGIGYGTIWKKKTLSSRSLHLVTNLLQYLFNSIAYCSS